MACREPRGSPPPAPTGADIQAPPAGCSSADPDSPGPPRRLASSFSVEALLARPGPRAPAGSSQQVPCAAPLLPAARCQSPALALPWPGPETPPPAYLSVGPCLLCLQPPVLWPGFWGLPSLGATGLELAHYPGLQDPPYWALHKDHQDIERPPKRVRVMFNLKQLEELEKVFAQQHNLVGKKRAQLAARLNLTENQVRVWFQNRRVKYQKQQRLELLSTSTMTETPLNSSDTSIKRDGESRVDS